VVRRFAENNQRIYDLFVSPFVRASSNALSAHMLRESHPARVERSVMSDANPALGVLPAMAESVREHRKPVAPDNPFKQLEKQASASIEASWDAYRDARDAWVESTFYNVYTAPWVQAWVGVAPSEPLEPIAPPLMALRKELAQYRLRAARAHLTKGTLVDAFMRIAAYIVDEMHTVQYRPFQRMRELAREYLGDRQPSIAELKEAARRQGAIVQLDPQAAIEALPELVPEMKTRRALLAAVYRIATVSAPLEGERRERYRDVQRALGVEPGSEKTGLPPIDGGSSSDGTPSGGVTGSGGSASGEGVAAQAAGDTAAAAKETARKAATEHASPARPVRAARAGVKAKAAKAMETAEAKKAPAAVAKTSRRSRAAATPTATRAAGTTATRRRASRSATE
jgi:hypothetical protein